MIRILLTFLMSRILMFNAMGNELYNNDAFFILAIFYEHFIHSTSISFISFTPPTFPSFHSLHQHFLHFIHSTNISFISFTPPTFPSFHSLHQHFLHFIHSTNTFYTTSIFSLHSILQCDF